jgi:hypothetical protein
MAQSMPEAKSTIVDGSGVLPVLDVDAEPMMVNDSEGIEPIEFSEAEEGPEFSSQYTGSLLPLMTAFSRVSQ